VARALAAAVVASLLAVSGAGGATSGQRPQSPHVGGTVVFGPIAPEPKCLNPLTPTRCSTGVLPSWILEKVLTPTFTVAPDLSLRPSLVSKATYTTKTPFIITYHIRPEARWSDGIPVSARDFVFTQQATRRYSDPDDWNRTEVRSVRAVDAKTVRVVLRNRFAGWRGLFGSVLPRHALRSEDLTKVWFDRIDNPKTGKPIGNGPFLVARWEPGKQLTLVRNPRYWGPHLAHLDRLVVRFFQGGAGPATQILEGLRRGEVDFAATRVTDLIPDLRRIPGIRILGTSTDAWEHIVVRVLPQGHPALQDKRVRRALAYGINRVALVRALFGELDPSYQPSDSAVFLADHASYRPNWNGYRYRPAESRRLLEQAGCRRGTDGIYVCDGRRLRLRLLTLGNALQRERTVQLVQTQLRQAGVEVELGFTTGGALFNQILPSGDFDLTSFTTFVSADASGQKDLYGCGGSGNYSGYCQRLVTKDLDQADRILDADRRGVVLNRADRQLAKDVPVIPLYQFPNVLALRRTVKGVVVSPYNLLWNAEDWRLER
jgi:peptide/nickel transport system substrate-binding protein